jgi:type I restriction enzyme S subunit
MKNGWPAKPVAEIAQRSLGKMLDKAKNKGTPRPYLRNQHVSIIRPISDKLDADFLHYLLISKPYKDQLLQTGAEGGATRQAITKAQIQDFVIEYPESMTEQKTIVGKLDGILVETQHLESLYQRKLAALDELKKSLLHHAFSGQL